MATAPRLVPKRGLILMGILKLAAPPINGILKRATPTINRTAPRLVTKRGRNLKMATARAPRLVPKRGRILMRILKSPWRTGASTVVPTDI